MTDEELRLEAIERISRLATTEATRAERSRVEQWRKLSPRHERAWREAEQAWELMGRLPAVPLTATSHGESRTGTRVPSRSLAMAIAAAVAITAIVILGPLAPEDSARSVRDTSEADAGIAVPRERFATAWGQRRTVRLDDGSTVQMNSDSRLEVRLGESSRRIELLRGEALFEVASDPARPFVVNVQQTSVAALGTVFMVRRLAEGDSRVTVLEGRVAVSATAGRTVDLGADNAIESSGATLREPEAVDAERMAAWRRGVLIFRDSRLDDVLAEIDRYTPYGIEAELGHLRDDEVTGTFFIDRLDESLSGVLTSFDLTVVSNQGDVLRLAPAAPARPGAP